MTSVKFLAGWFSIGVPNMDEKKGVNRSEDKIDWKY
jgi:hypothetical protein